nr:retrovirus-related Pol polyprotein from transposon TNT 1-94 [Tanacetum cinerariifolium]
MKTEALTEQAKAAKPVRALTLYPPNTPVKLVPKKLLLPLVTPKIDPSFTLVTTKPYMSCEDIGKLQPTTDVRIFVGYAPSRKGYRIYNKRTRRIMESIHVQFDELSEPIAPVQPISPTPYDPPSKKDYEILFQPFFDEYVNPLLRAVSPVSTAVAAPRVVDPAGSPSSTTIDQDVPSVCTSLTI